MDPFKILIPTDFSAQATYAGDLVRQLKSSQPIELHFLHVLQLPDTVSINAAGEIDSCGEIDISYVKAQKQVADANMARLQLTYGSDVFTHVVPGSITDTILQFAKANDVQLIVMGTKGAVGLQEKLSGSETQVVARRSSVPVLSLMCDRSHLQLNKLLLVHDFSHPLQGELAPLQKLLDAFSPGMLFLQVVKGDAEEQRELVEANMKRFAEINGIDEYEPYLVSDHDVLHGVNRFTQLHEVDVVCIGILGSAHLFHEHTTEKLINHLYKPILSFQLHKKVSSQ